MITGYVCRLFKRISNVKLFAQTGKQFINFIALLIKLQKRHEWALEQGIPRSSVVCTSFKVFYSGDQSDVFIIDPPFLT